MMVVVALAMLAGLAWLYQKNDVGHIAALHDAEISYGERLADLEAELAAGQARHRGETDALWTTLSHERFRLESAEENKANLVHKLAALSERHENVVEQRDRLAAERASLTSRLHVAEKAANIAATAQAVWSAASSVSQNIPAIGDVWRAESDLRDAEATYERRIAEERARFASELAEVRGRLEGERDTLRESLHSERDTVRRLEERIETLTEKMVTISSDRARLRLEYVRLKAELDVLRAGAEDPGDYGSSEAKVIESIR
jgi:chromosome segregation ATPase